MKRIDNLKMGTKLIGGFGVVVVFMLIIAVAGYVAMDNINKGIITLYADRTLPIEQLGAANTALYTLRGDILKYVYIPAERATMKAAIQTDEDTIQKEMNLYRATYLVTEEQTELAVFDKNYASFQQVMQNIITNVDEGNQDLAVKSVLDGGDVTVTRKAVGANLDTLLNINVTVADQIKVQSDATFTSTRDLLIGTALLAFLLAVLLVVIITRSVTVPLSLIVKISQALGSGDLVRHMSDREKEKTLKRKDEIGDVGKALNEVIIYLQETAVVASTIADNDLTVTVQPKSEKDEMRIAFVRMIASLRKSLAEVAESANGLGAASSQLASAAYQAGQATDQIANTIQQVSAGITQESEAVTQTTSSIEQMSRAIEGIAQGAQEQARATQTVSTIAGQISNSIEQVAQNAQSVNQEAGKAAVSAQDGANKVSLTLKGMQSIRAKVGLSAQKVAEMGQHSEKITIIVETIEDIASQTNLLALNAAIEAAHAGEHGKGFSVVAEEVRKLAERASVSTKEIGALIKGIQRTVAEAVAAMQEGTHEIEDGVLQAKDAGTALESILKSTAAVTKEANEAASAATQMSTSARELVSAVDSVSAVVEENTAATEEMAAGSTAVTQAIENIASVSEENSASVEEVSASTEEMAAQVEEVAASAQSLEEMAQVLKDLVSRFKLNQESATPRVLPSSPIKAKSSGALRHAGQLMPVK